MSELEITPDFARAVEIVLETNKNLFITGKAGTGKSTLLRYIRDNSSKNTVVVAPTGISAINVEGQTIHSLFRLKPGGGLEDARKSGNKLKSKEVIQNLELLIIDEISMVRADLLDMVDICLKTAREDIRPFGGVQIVMIGDLYQLPPVVTYTEQKALQEVYTSSYFFASRVFEYLLENLQDQLEFIELGKIYRQSDSQFIDLLNKIRYKDISDEDLQKLNSKVNPAWSELNQGHIILTTRNADAADINQSEMDKLTSTSKLYTGKIKGDFNLKTLPTELNLELKVGARVMFLKNHSAGLWVNGTLGYITELNFDSVEVLTDGGLRVDVGVEKWEILAARFDAESQSIVNDKIGSFEQLPLKLSWAITIHKAQGQTFDKVILDLGKGAFSNGQTYVALSRCTSLDGLVLAREIKKSDIRTDYQVSKFLTSLEYALASQEQSLEAKTKIIKQALAEGKKLSMVYLKAKNLRSQRVIKPYSLEDRDFKGEKFLALEGYCCSRQADRVFNVDRILSLELVD